MRTFRKLAGSSMLALSLLAVGSNAPVFAAEGEPVSYEFTWDEPQPVSAEQPVTAADGDPSSYEFTDDTPPAS